MGVSGNEVGIEKSDSVVIYHATENQAQTAKHADSNSIQRGNKKGTSGIDAQKELIPNAQTRIGTTSDKGISPSNTINATQPKSIDVLMHNTNNNTALEAILLRRQTRRICGIRDLENALIGRGEWAAVPQEEGSPYWLGARSRKLYQETLRPCYKRFGLKYPEFCTVKDDEALQIYLPPDCALPTVNAKSFAGRRVIMIGDSIMRSAAIGLVALLTEAWDYPYDVMVSEGTKQDRGFCSGWASTGATVCWVNYKTANFGHHLPTILGQALSSSTVDDVIILNFGIHYRISPGPFDYSMKQLQALLHEPKYEPQASLIWVETEPQYFNRGVYIPPDEDTKGEGQDSCHALDIDTWKNTSKIANRYNDRLRARLETLQRENLLQISPLWDAFARLGPRDVLGRRVTTDDKLDCTHSCLMKEKHLYRIQQLQIVLDSKPAPDSARLKKKEFLRQWGRVQADVFGGEEEHIRSYRSNRKLTDPANKCRQNTFVGN
ncbi:hypothetical protein SARC_03518 [Sphaeroforma arctica JP610]|uniref:Uncharacterized protein n=1 Tax=Sphaeroforma arctica JP610 TaxID=667725 RepID=A0A0L0G5X7_9EUKA|nr:hypothetical protein SARC_03518 [Sphaeroforma arctica JP610]KNC84246.1 hypothetical protein SARC_03518 [Sphaeroforma arctica JP610]|eukprot:XP_014158148.1 hypothetical protein SARC_03518 [Sphaeroforma arctica JP610]